VHFPWKNKSSSANPVHQWNQQAPPFSQWIGLVGKIDTGKTHGKMGKYRCFPGEKIPTKPVHVIFPMSTIIFCRSETLRGAACLYGYFIVCYGKSHVYHVFVDA
jgi:hypothetical protein